MARKTQGLTKIVFVIIFCVMLFSFSLSATAQEAYQRLTPEELVNAAEVIVAGEVGPARGVREVQGPNEENVVVTDRLFFAKEYFTNAGPKVLMIKTSGGTLKEDGVERKVEGYDLGPVGSKVLLILKPDSSSRLITVGGPQGVIPLDDNLELPEPYNQLLTKFDSVKPVPDIQILMLLGAIGVAAFTMYMRIKQKGQSLTSAPIYTKIIKTTLGLALILTLFYVPTLPIYVLGSIKGFVNIWPLLNVIGAIALYYSATKFLNATKTERKLAFSILIVAGIILILINLIPIYYYQWSVFGEGILRDTSGLPVGVASPLMLTWHTLIILLSGILIKFGAEKA